MSLVRIALLGATSHIAKGLIAAWGRRDDRKLFLYARSPERVKDFVTNLGLGEQMIFPAGEFGRIACDVVVNCIGIADPGKLNNDAARIFSITETWDCRIMEYLSAYPDALYINLSSGAAYGCEFSRPVDESTSALFPVNALSTAEYYGVAKLHAEARHRAAAGLNIVDLRFFSYFSRFIDPGTRFLMTDIITAVESGREMMTTPVNIVRDYIHPEDMVSLMDCVIACNRINDVYDVYSLKPATKFEILELFREQLGLRFRVTEGAHVVTATGIKEHYYSLNHRAERIGYQPRHDSLDALLKESRALLDNGKVSARPL